MLTIKLLCHWYVVLIPLMLYNRPLSYSQNINETLKQFRNLAYSKPDVAMRQILEYDSLLISETDSFNYLYTKSFILYQQSNTEQALYEIQHLDTRVKQSNSTFRKHYLTLAIIHSDKEEYRDAIMCLLKAIDEDPEIRINGVPYLNLGYYYGKIKENALEERYFQTGYNRIMSLSDNNQKAYACNMMGMYMERCGKDDKAIEFYTKGKYYARKAERWEKYIDNVVAISTIELKRKNYEQVEFLLYETENYYSECLSPRAPAMGTLLFAKLYLELNNYHKADKYYNLACRYSKNITYATHLKDLFHFGIKLYTMMGHSKNTLTALEQYKKVDLKSATKISNNKPIIELSNFHYKTLNENILLKKHRNIWIVISLSLICLLFVLALTFKRKIKILTSISTELNHPTNDEISILKSNLEDRENELVRLQKNAEQQQEELHLIRFLFALPDGLRNYELGPLKELAFSQKHGISDNALELLRSRLLSQHKPNFKSDKVKSYYANIELEQLTLPEKFTDKYARFFNLCLNLANKNYKVSEIEHIASNKNELYYLCKTISGKSPNQLKEQLTRYYNN